MMSRAESTPETMGVAAGTSPAGPVSSWLYLVWLCFRRQARARQMVAISLGLLVVTLVIVQINTIRGRWGMSHWRSPRRIGLTYEQWADNLAVAGLTATPGSPPAAAISTGVTGACQVVLEHSGFLFFSRFVVFSIFLSFLLPLWSLSFATEALSGEREDRSLIWLLMRPWSRSAIYLAKFTALLPWSLTLNLGGFALLCLAAGSPGMMALRLYWPAVLAATLAFSALFHLMGAVFRRAALVAILYSFFLETILGNMPGTMKRVSIGFYTRCLMFESAQEYGVQAEKPSVYMPVDGTTAWVVLLGLTVLLLALGLWVFSRKEYGEEN